MPIRLFTNLYETYPIGKANPPPPPRMGWAYAPPTEGVWDKGDTVWNMDPENDPVLGWKCTTQNRVIIWVHVQDSISLVPDPLSRRSVSPT